MNLDIVFNLDLKINLGGLFSYLIQKDLEWINLSFVAWGQSGWERRSSNIQSKVLRLNQVSGDRKAALKATLADLSLRFPGRRKFQWLSVYHLSSIIYLYNHQSSSSSIIDLYLYNQCIFEAIVESIMFLSLFSFCLSIRNLLIFVLILYPATLLNMFFSCKNLLVEF